MSGHAFTLIAEKRHQHSNAQKIRAWFAARPDIKAEDRRAYVADYLKRGYLSKQDADKLAEES